MRKEDAHGRHRRHGGGTGAARRPSASWGPAAADEIAEAICFLATHHASFIYGLTLAVDGGRSAVYLARTFVPCCRTRLPHPAQMELGWRLGCALATRPAW